VEDGEAYSPSQAGNVEGRWKGGERQGRDHSTEDQASGPQLCFVCSFNAMLSSPVSSNYI